MIKEAAMLLVRKRHAELHKAMKDERPQYCEGDAYYRAVGDFVEKVTAACLRYKEARKYQQSLGGEISKDPGALYYVARGYRWVTKNTDGELYETECRDHVKPFWADEALAVTGETYLVHESKWAQCTHPKDAWSHSTPRAEV